MFFLSAEVGNAVESSARSAEVSVEHRSASVLRRNLVAGRAMNVTSPQHSQRLVLAVRQTDEGIDAATAAAQMIQHQPITRDSPVANLQWLVVVTHMLGSRSIGFRKDAVDSGDEAVDALVDGRDGGGGVVVAHGCNLTEG